MIRETNTENGYVRGLQGTNARISVFKGIPFAKAPVGDLRWRAPQPKENWEGVRNCFEFGPISVQDTPGMGTDIYCREFHVDSQIAMNEDCLYLNVWTPAKSTDERLPVLVWYFGGGFQWGYTAEMEFDGEHLAKKGIVVVSVNYRLGALGFLTHPELIENQKEDPANFGLLDQKAGLEWVTRNIENFGGDSKNITIAGQSAGGASVLNQIVCPDNFDKIKGAIILSGVIRSPYSVDKFITPGPASDMGKIGEKFFEFLGVKTLEEGRKLDAFEIRDKYAEFAKENPRFSVCVDNSFLSGDPYKLYLAGKHAHVPLMCGNTEDEFLSFISCENEEELKKESERIFGDYKEEFLNFKEAHEKLKNNEYAPVRGIECSIKAMYERNIENGFKENNYYYEFGVDIPGWDNPGTFHSVDLWFFFDNLDKCWRPFEGRHFDIARQMSNYWVNFIKNHDPNGEDLPGKDLLNWKPYPYGVKFTKDGPKEKEEDSDFIKFLSKQIKLKN